jgi:Sec-independent protein translocase protein TatA
VTSIRSLRRRFGIAAPRVAIQTHVAWYWRWLTILMVIAVVVGLGWLAFDLGRRYAGFDRGEAEREQARMEELNRKLQDENAAVRREIASAERKLHIELSTQGNLSSQIRALSEENSLLKEDLAFFQTLMASGGDPGGITVNRFRVQRDALPGEYRYRLLIVQSKQRVREFRGHLQFIVDFEEGGKASVITLPAEGDALKAYNLNFKFYQRVEGTFMLAPGAVVKKVQVRVLESGDPTPVSTQTVTLS